MLIVLASLALSYSSILQLVADKSLLPMGQVYDRGDDAPPDPFLIGFTFKSEADAASLHIEALDASRSIPGLVEKQQNCPAGMAKSLGWTMCYLITMKTMPATGQDSGNYVVAPWLTITATTSDSFILYMETFDINAAIGSSPKNFYTKEIAQGTTC